ncbi:MAG: DOPA 4,5-dioxygenase family protein [Proteobacteria bacterium]|nr:DOPA 4,5-dioxygenase family protein [Pseudomonadota bacterium]
MAEIAGYHAHIYFDEKTFDQARELCEQARDRFGVSMGRMHRKPVGPHPRWSCLIAFSPDKFGAVVPWLATNRGGLAVLIHPETGNDYKDHTDHAIWMGTMLPLDLAKLQGRTL